MMGKQHRLFAALGGAWLATEAGQPWQVVIMAALAASSTADGWSSPDMDLTGPFRAVSALGLGWLFGHRKITHWWAWPALAHWWWFPALPDAGWQGVSPSGLAQIMLIGWVSHLASDAVFGTVPLAPWGWNVGLGLKTDGWIETVPVRWATIGLLGWTLIGRPAWSADWHVNQFLTDVAQGAATFWQSASAGTQTLLFVVALVAIPLSAFVGVSRGAKSGAR